MKFFLFVACQVLALAAFAQDSPPRLHQQTTTPSNARYEVIQSSLAVRHTFRLDRYTGRVWQLVRTKDDDNAWEEMPVLDPPRVTNPSRARFQLFSSGFAVRHTFMFDTDTGKSWVVVSTKRKAADGSEYEIALWQPFAE